MEYSYTLEDAIKREKEISAEKYKTAFLCHSNPDDGKLNKYVEEGRFHEYVVSLLEELKEYKDNHENDLK